MSVVKLAALKPQIVKKKEFQVVGIARNYDVGTDFKIIYEQWEDFRKVKRRIKHAANKNTLFGIGEMIDGDLSKFTYITAIEVNSNLDLPEDMVYRRIPTHKYAVFTHKGLVDEYMQTISYVYESFLPKSELTVMPGASIFEILEDGRFSFRRKKNEIDVYLPIKD